MARKILLFLCSFLLVSLCNCSYSQNSNCENQTIETSVLNIQSELANDDEIVELRLKNLSLEEKIAQLFILAPEQLVDGYSNITAAGDATKTAFNNRPIGGIIYMDSNIVNPYQTKSMLRNMNEISYKRINIPALLCVDEEGGMVARIANNSNFNVPHFSRMSTVGQSNNPQEAYHIGEYIGGYLSDLGFNVDFAPVADVLTNEDNTVVRGRTFSSDAEAVRIMTAAISRGLQSKGILTSYKHFPGHGNTAEDSHKSYAYSNKTKEELYKCELIPFIDAIKNNEPFIMVGHISMPKLTGDDTPASLSKTIVTDLLRNELGFTGLIITDALNMGAICNEYSADQAARKALDAGVDVLLMPQNFNIAYSGILQAVKDGKISEARINQSVARILKMKIKLARTAGRI